MNSDKNLLEKLKKVTIDTILSSTSHGLPNVFRSTNVVIRIIWISFTLISASYCVFNIINCVIKFFDYEVTTKTRLSNEYMSLFPTVTVCNVNFFTSENAVEFIKTIEDQKFSKNPFEDSFELYAKGIIENSSNFSQVRQNVGDSKEKLIVFCMYSRKACNMSWIRYYYHSIYGNCFNINSGIDENDDKVPIFQAVGPKRFLGLRLILNVSVAEEIKFLKGNMGAQVIIHNKTESPFMTEGIFLSPKSETNIALTRTFYSSLPKPYSSCESNTNDKDAYQSELYKQVFENGFGYNQILCVGFCFQRLMIRNCKCYQANLPYFSNSPPCVSPEQKICYEEQIKLISGTDYIEDVCFKECPLECEGMFFEKTASINQFSNEEWIKYLQEYNGSDSVYFNRTLNADHLTAVNIYYERMSYFAIDETRSMIFTDLLSSIGGTAGLFLGISFLSLVEILELLIQFFLVFKNQNKVG
ncbi:acid-sensing ion channel 1 isoform X2 [Brachionus plicatilis]|uniref:Acid-sensing ion channel 1 isoform X2 n=1 Tax=Brachionus plicatilis TaxID=10195 RepID=A0A3M7QHP0_BRAPC|nr:acid-sensing ion channel 1 isoform X2 [Brachionus plicatilis]